MKAVSVHLSETAYIEMKILASARGRPVAELIRQAMEEYLERERSRRQSLLDRAPHESGRLLRPWTRDELLEEMVSPS
ncbi:MAG: ribbon-helix-helix domain-containing protein [Vicinamibacteria bacterium]